jgi:hypothetical protein
MSSKDVDDTSWPVIQQNSILKTRRITNRYSFFCVWIQQTTFFLCCCCFIVVSVLLHVCNYCRRFMNTTAMEIKQEYQSVKISHLSSDKLQRTALVDSHLQDHLSCGLFTVISPTLSGSLFSFIFLRILAGWVYAQMSNWRTGKCA